GNEAQIFCECERLPKVRASLPRLLRLLLRLKTQRSFWKYSCAGLVERDGILVADAISTKNIQRRANGEVHPALPQSRNGLQVIQRPSATRVSSRNGSPRTEMGNQCFIYAPAKSFDIHGMD